MAHHVQINQDQTVLDDIPYSNGDIAELDDDAFNAIPPGMFTSGKLTDLGETGGGGGGGSAPSSVVRTVTAATPLDTDGNVPITIADGTVLVDASGGDIGLALPESPPQGTCIRFVRVSPDDAHNVYITTSSDDPAGYGGTNSSLFHQFEERIAYYTGDAWSVIGSGAVNVGDLADFTHSAMVPDGIVEVITYDGNTGRWRTSVAGQRTLTSIDNTGSGWVAGPGAVVRVDASGGNTIVGLQNKTYSMVTVKKTDASANTVTVQSQGGPGFSQIDGADTFVITAQNQVVTFMRGNDGLWHTI